MTGAGRGYCAGADLERGRGDVRRAGARVLVPGTVPRDNGGQFTLRIFNSEKPVIGAINGPAVGVGATMTLPMDIRLASENARFGFVFVRRGIVPGGRLELVPAARRRDQPGDGVGRDRTRVLGRRRRSRAGSCAACIRPTSCSAAARELAKEIVDNASPVSVALARRMMWRMLGAPHPMSAHRVDSRAMLARGQSADVVEGVTSFLEKRPPRFTDKVSDGLPDVFPEWKEPAFG